MTQPANPTSLERPRSTVPTKVFLRYLVPVIAVHLLVLLAVLPEFFSWTGVIACLAGIHIFGQAITIGYHRLLTHRSFQTPRWLEWTMVTLALCCLQDSPARWVATHRMHHVHSDEEEDPHSPLVAFVWGHMGWLFLRNHDLTHISNYSRYARDMLADPFYFWIERHPIAPLCFYLAQCVPYFGIPLLLSMLMGTAFSQALVFATSVLIWGVFVRTVCVWHITWSVNSLTHMFGYQNHATGENSRNNWLVALIAAGEGWHNNHHHDQACCTLQHRWWEFDLTYWEIRALRLVGLASDLKVRREERVRLAGARNTNS